MTVKIKRDLHVFDKEKAIRIETIIRPIKNTARTRPILVYIFKCRYPSCLSEIRVDDSHIKRHSGFCKSCSLKETYRLKSLELGVPDKHKKCPACKNIKLFDDFGFNRSGTPRSYCKKCSNERSLSWHRNNRERSEASRKRYRKENLKYKDSRQKERCLRYGITPEAYDKILENQKGVCAVCGLAEPNASRRNFSKLAIDHDHLCCPGAKSCGKCVRGLLCTKCNTALGMLQDSPETIVKLLSYLRSYKREE